MQRIFRLLCVCVLISVAQAEDIKDKVIWQADFSKDGKLSWKCTRSLPEDDFSISKKELIMQCSCKPHKGTLFEVELPPLDQGELIFEVNANAKAARGYNNLSLIFRFWNQLTAFRPKRWAYYDGKRWSKNYGAIDNAKWYTCKIAFDRKRRTIDFFVDDMDNPVGYFENVKFPDHCILQIGNYGLASGMITNKLRDICLIKTQTVKKAVKTGNHVMLFRGMCFEDYQLKALSARLSTSAPEIFDLVTKLGLLPENQFILSRLPSRGSVYPGYIIMADMPLNAGITPRIQRTFRDAVANGATLIILGGLFTLNKGEFKDSLLAEILPVEISSPWDVIDLKRPMEIKGFSGAFVQYLHKLPVKSGAEVKLQVNGVPFLVTGKYKSGRAIVCLGMPVGKFDSDQTVFGKSPDWLELIAKLAKNQ